MNINTLSYSKYLVAVSAAVCVLYSAQGAGDGLTQNGANSSITNTGTIITKRKSVRQTGGTIANNEGRIVIDGQAVITQDTLSGRVEYIYNDKTENQYIPQIRYNDVYFSGASKKMLTAPSLQLTADKKFSSDASALFTIDKTAGIDAKGKVDHNGSINPDQSFGAFRMNGENSQDIEGKGSFQEVDLNNGAGADVRNGGGFKINSKLELTKGELRNSAENNFEMGESALIVRSVEGSVAHEPIFKENISVKYTGNGAIASGAELPNDKKVLKTLTVENTGGLTLLKSVTVNDSLRMAANITTTGVDSTRVLTLASKNNPEFINPDAEVIGSIRRNNLVADSSKIVFNNQHTYAQFADASARGGVSELTYTVLPATFPTPDDGQRVKRSMSISASDLNGATITGGFSMRVGFGWRDGSSVDETGALSIPEIVLQTLSGGTWVNAGLNNIQSFAANGWGVGQAEGVQSIGSFSFGGSTFIPLALNAKIMLEGAYRNGSMAKDLLDSSLIPTTPPSIYPYNLDPNRAFINVAKIPDGVVDWVVVELRSEQTGGNTNVQTCFVDTNGRLVGLDGKSSLRLPDVKSGDFYIAIRHRNHLAVMTSEPRTINPKTIQNIVDFTTGQGVLGGSSALKPVGRNNAGSLVFGMAGGDVNGDGKIDEEDAKLAWEETNKENEYLNTDTNMDGVINTKDHNTSWNNRGKESVVPK
ncbi:MAG: hypothetical protein V4642_01505 [Bacteroidota bacterium]